jgi:hypothetical protein
MRQMCECGAWYWTEEGKQCKCPSAASADPPTIPAILFDGYTVFQMVEHRGNHTKVSHDNVAEVLDAVVACIRSIPE